MAVILFIVAGLAVYIYNKKTSDYIPVRVIAKRKKIKEMREKLTMRNQHEN